MAEAVNPKKPRQRVTTVRTRSLSRLTLPFSKMHGLGNDFIMLGARELANTERGEGILLDWENQAPEFARMLCNRHLGIGADGLILVIDTKNDVVPNMVKRYPDLKKCRFAWTYINSDGSWSDMCGNGLRCVTLWIHEQGLMEGKDVLIATKCGPIKAHFENADAITVDLGEPIFRTSSIPLSGRARERFVAEEINVGSTKFNATCVSVGNPHCVIFNPSFVEEEKKFFARNLLAQGGFDLTNALPKPVAALAPQIQALPLFPEGANVEFAFVRSKTEVDVIVWERGCGPTFACASGAAAVLVAGCLEKRLERESEIRLPGGVLRVSWSEKDNRVSLTGPACQTYNGRLAFSTSQNELIGQVSISPLEAT